MLKIILLTTFYCALVFAFPDRNARIFNGRNAMAGEFPYMASLRYWGNTFHVAGGSLLNNRWVVTVATPLIGRRDDSINIVLGTNMLNAGVVNRRSNLIRRHELFDPATRRNDIALVRLLTAVQFTQFIAPIAISATFIDYDIVGTIMGWGATEFSNGIESNILRVATTTTVRCENNNEISITQNQMCAGIIQVSLPGGNAEGALCKGDIGGPMVFGYQLVGIAIWHPARCASTPDVYNRAASYRGWILGII